MEKTRKAINLSLCAGVILLAAGGFGLLLATKPAPVTTSAAPRTPTVSVQVVEPVVCSEPIVGYGTVRPKRQVKIVPEVGGKLIFVHPDMAPGNVIEKGEVLFEIEPRVYESKVAQVESEIRRLEAQLRRHEQEKVNIEARLELALRQQELASKSVEREHDLMRQDSGTAPEVEAAQERLLRHEDSVMAYRSQLALIPLQMDETQALLATKQAQFAEARLNVENTRIVCPFDARVDSVTAQESQVVIASFQIATLTDMEALEVSVVVDPRELRWTDEAAFATAMGEDRENAPEARVAWTLRGQEFSWSGRVTRLEKLDEVTRSAHIVVEIRDVMLSLDLSKGQTTPPLSVGMFCRAELPTAPLDDALLVPRHAIHEGQFVYVFEPDANEPSVGRLAMKRVPVLRSVGENVLVRFGTDDSPESKMRLCELEPGDRVITSPLPKAIENMRLQLRTDDVAVAVVTEDLESSTPWASASVRGETPWLLAAFGAR